VRRNTPGNIDASELLPPKIRRAEAHDAASLIRKLEPLVLERRRERMKEVIAKRLASVTVMFDSPYDPHNGAAIVRSCEAFGVQSLHVIERTAKFLVAPSVARGAEKWVDVNAYPSPEPALAAVKNRHFKLVAAHPDGELVPSDLSKMERVCIVLGNERSGIGADLLHVCDARVRVPMRGFIESLNVSVTAAILLAAATEGRKGDLPERDQQRLYARGLYFSVERVETVLDEAPDPSEPT
jgi:tRNA (guanosine-2'-O-)-methyltransferase